MGRQPTYARTEAAAVTSVGITIESAGPSVIRERFSGTIIFMGKVLDPRS
ncbi:MAG: hypothetical protein IID05_08045 [Gemmatimonadetes bacterium]|nr:hypothetical protein [Gemmatimonadota bacterium]